MRPMIFNMVVLVISGWITYSCYKWMKDERQKKRQRKQRAERLRLLEELRKRNTNGQ